MIKINKLSSEFKNVIKLVSEVSKKINLPVYLVGGCLRDLILGAKNFDLDFVVEGNGILFAQKLAKKLKSGLRIHERFGTATLHLPKHLKIDIATARKEKYPKSASLPVVSPGTLEDDLFRRDFTINAIAALVYAGRIDKPIDPFGGIADLAAKKIRVLHDLSFVDDPTRILRAVRFQQRFNFKIEPKTLALLNQAIKEGLLNQVHGHRMRDELILMLKEKNPLKHINRLAALGGLYFIDDKLIVNKAMHNLFKSVDRELAWFEKNFSHRRPLDSWLIYLTVLLSKLTLSQVRAAADKLGLRSGETKRIMCFCLFGRNFINCLNKKDLLPAKIFQILEPLSYETIILLRVTSKNKYLKKYIADFFEIYNGMRLEVSGSHLHQLGVLPGPKYTKIFTQVLNAKLNGKVKNQKEELALIKELAKKIN